MRHPALHARIRRRRSKFPSDHVDHGAIGWIEVQQADGSWNAFPRVYNGYGNNHCHYERPQNVQREQAAIKIVSCFVDGRYGTPYWCRSDVIGGA